MKYSVISELADGGSLKVAECDSLSLAEHIMHFIESAGNINYVVLTDSIDPTEGATDEPA